MQVAEIVHPWKKYITTNCALVCAPMLWLFRWDRFDVSRTQPIRPYGVERPPEPPCCGDPPSIQKRLQVITRQKRQFSHLSQILVPM